MENRIHAELRDLLKVFPPLDLDNLHVTRSGMGDAPPALRDERVTIEDKIIVGTEGNELRIRTYKPVKQQQTSGGLLWIHGGGYVLGTPEGDDELCQRFVTEAECVVVSVDYRLAPEHPYPAPLEDCYSALKWLADNASELGVDPTCLGIAGASAGGGLTAALALLARDRKGPALAFQMPLYPMIDDRNNSSSAQEITGNLIWNHSLNEKGWSMYLNGANGSEDVPYTAAPARAEDLSGLPYTYTCVGQLDPFRDETLQYVTRLCQAGVDVEFHLYPGCYHGFETLNSTSEVGARAIQEYVDAVKRALRVAVAK